MAKDLLSMNRQFTNGQTQTHNGNTIWCETSLAPTLWHLLAPTLCAAFSWDSQPQSHHFSPPLQPSHCFAWTRLVCAWRDSGGACLRQPLPSCSLECSSCCIGCITKSHRGGPFCSWNSNTHAWSGNPSEQWARTLNSCLVSATAAVLGRTAHPFLDLPQTCHNDCIWEGGAHACQPPAFWSLIPSVIFSSIRRHSRWVRRDLPNLVAN